jgi:hypothetical protein
VQVVAEESQRMVSPMDRAERAPRGSIFHLILPADAAVAAGRQAARPATDAAGTSRSWRAP